MPMLVSLPVAEITGLAAVAALASVKLFTAEPVAVIATRVLAFVSLIDVLIAGVTNVGLVANTKAPLPVSSDITPFNCNDVVDANCDNFAVSYYVLFVSYYFFAVSYFVLFVS